MMFFTPGSIPVPCGWPRTCALQESSSPLTPGSAFSAASASAWIFAFSGQAGVVSSMVAKIRPPSTRTPFTIPACTRLTFSSGSITVLSAASTSFSVGIVTPNGPGAASPGAGTLARARAGCQTSLQREHPGCSVLDDHPDRASSR